VAGEADGALRAVTVREIIKFVQQRGRLLSALVRPLMWLAVFAAGFYNVFGVSIIPPYKTYITYQVYIGPGLLGIILLFHGMQSSLSMVYDREMGVMRLLLTAPLPRWVLLACKLVAGTALSVIICYVFLAVCILFDVTFDASGWLYVLPALIVSGLMLGALLLAQALMVAGTERTVLQCGLVLGGFVAMGRWTRRNRAALDHLDWCECASSRVSVRVIPSGREHPARPRPERPPRPRTVEPVESPFEEVAP